MKTRATDPPAPNTEHLPELTEWAAKLLADNPRPWPAAAAGVDRRIARDFFRAEGIGPLCHYTLQATGARELVPPPVWELLRQERQAATALELLRGHRDAHALRCLGEIGLKPLVLKGAAYARTIYPEPDLRPRCDTDLLFADRTAAEAACARLASEGYETAPNIVEGRFVSRQKTCFLPTAGGHAIDLHWAISNSHTFVRALPQTDLIREAVPLPALHPDAATLDPVRSLLFACVHLFGHERYGHWPRLLWLYDIYRLSKQLSDADWADFRDKAIPGRIAGICRHVLDQAGQWFPISPAAGLRAALIDAEADEVFRPDRLKSHLHFAWYDMVALADWGERRQWIRETLFPSAEYMRSKYATARITWLPLLYLRRSATGLARRLGLKNPSGP